MNLKRTLCTVALAGMLAGSSVSANAADFTSRFWNLRTTYYTTPSTSSTTGGWGNLIFGYKWTLVQYRAVAYDRYLSRIFGRPVSPFCRIFC